MKSLIGLLCALPFLTGVLRAQEPSSAPGSDSFPAPVRSRPVFENDTVRVLRIELGPRERVPLHEVTPRLVVWLTAGSLRLTFADGHTVIDSHGVGEVEWLPQQRHAGENLGDTPVVLLAVLVKPPTAAP